ncbi:MAG: murein L,D-transpeptidase catalytic domain-containing protein [Bdellovibrionales bacterium]
MQLLKTFGTLILAAIMYGPLASNAQFDPAGEIGEGFDKQSPEEIEKARREIEALFSDAVGPKNLKKAEAAAILQKYQHLDPKNEVPTDLLEEAVLFLDRNLAKFPNRAYITVIDFKPRSDVRRFFVINMTTGEVEKFFTTHGIGSDKNKNGIAEIFGNIVNSGMSSLGYIRTAEVYWGKFKRSVRLDGLSATNSKVRERAVVLHGWDNAHEKPVIQGLSWGCPALDWTVKDAVIDKVKEGSLMYIGVSKK